MRKLIAGGGELEVRTSEIHHPSGGHHGMGTRVNAQVFIDGLISKVRGGNSGTTINRYSRLATSVVGTPHRLNADLDVYIFELFNEDNKPEDEQNFGLFYPNMHPMYQVDFVHGDPVQASYCATKATAGDAALQAALDYACRHGAYCSAIQPGKPCYEPNTKLAHAS